MFWLIVIVLIFLGAIAIKTLDDAKNRDIAIKKLSADERLKGAKIFKKWIQSPIAITNNGYVGFFNYGIRVFNIKDVNGFEVLVGRKNGQAGVIGTLLGVNGPINVESISLLFKMNDFNNPVIKIPLLSDGDDDGVDESLLEEITELISTLEYVEKNLKT